MRARACCDGYCVKSPNSTGEMQHAGSLFDSRIIRRLLACRTFGCEDKHGPIQPSAAAQRRQKRNTQKCYG
jgi:hypothetical protein